MWTSTAVIKLVHHTNCFAHVNNKFITNFFGNNYQNNYIKLIWEDNSTILWCVNTNVSDGCIGLNSLFAQRLGILEGTAVSLTVCSAPPILNQVTISTDSEEDYDILESNILKLQSCLLDQVKILVQNQKMVIWVSPSLSINIKSRDTSILKECTEVVVLPCSVDVSGSGSNFKLPKNIQCPIEKNNVSNFMQNQKETLLKYSKKRWSHLMRAMYIAEADILKKTEIVHNCLYIPANILDANLEKSLFHLQIMNQIDESNKDNNDGTITSFYVKLKPFVLDVLPCKINIFNKYMPVIVPNNLRRKLCIQSGDIFFLDEHDKECQTPEIIQISPVIGNTDFTTDDLLNMFKTYVLSKSTEEEPLLINIMDVIDVNSERKIFCQVDFHPKSIKCALINCKTLRNCKIIANQDKVQPLETVINQESPDLDMICREVGGFNRITEHSIDILKSSIIMNACNIKSDGKNKNNILILGVVGSGKSTLASIIVKDSGLWSLKLNCRSMKGRKDTIETFQKAVRSCEMHAPSVLICDDIESIFPCEKEGSSTQDLLFYEIQANTIKSIIHESVGVFTIMTSIGLEDIHSVFKVSKGDLLFSKTFAIPELTQDERSSLLKSIIMNSLYKYDHLKSDDYYRMSLDTAGLTVRDLVDYAIKNIFKAVKYAVCHDEVLNFSPQNIKAEVDDDKSDIWEAVGGLSSTKKKLTEIIYWPLKYPGLFPKQPGAILLFGPPGTGKSLIGCAISKLTEVSFINVKGPELLSKYIGQSEQSVRNLFKRAEKKKPCVIFFDEFDSLAPRRGHDSTGVTDRVVNQLLTQLDGVEGSIKGVTVVAATSRPDLLDGALLRPGRFDTYVHCSLPDQSERLEIFKIFSATLPLANDVDLEELSNITDNYTGADIKAILSTAQLTCIEEELARNADEDNKTSMNLMITQEQLLNALKETRPSLSVQQLAFYERTYDRFVKKPSIENVLKINSSLKQRATLA
ncbi:peroxisomal biogenesis factor 1 [Arctopsyche grandis]|uniref:peroxisomal biogenesis factor 1 n=1 Tax=Arctopsyche grandis TaxID=121162 RepID=UPI00406D9E87